MRAEWTKPELYIESYELTQHIATSCGTKTYIHIEPGQEIKFETGCIKNNGDYYSGGGHWYYEGTLTANDDTNGDGLISLEEWQAVIGAAMNDNKTGKGHYKEHTSSITIDGESYIFTEDEPFTS